MALRTGRARGAARLEGGKATGIVFFCGAIGGEEVSGRSASGLHPMRSRGTDGQEQQCTAPFLSEFLGCA